MKDRSSSLGPSFSLAFLLCWASDSVLGGGNPSPEPPFPPFYFSDAPFREALEQTQPAPLDQRVTGLTLPHHALALDLVAEGLALALGGEYERIIIVSPDHFRRGKTAGSTATRDFRTVLGSVATDRDAAARLAEDPLVSVSQLASHEHGFRAILPLLAEWFPGVPVLTLAVGIRTTPEEWEGLAKALDPLFTEKTLLIQSTDFSHYLTPAEAKRKDADTLRFLALRDAELVSSLRQPDHIDSKAAQWIQMVLQGKRGAELTVVNNRNSAAYAEGQEPRETTSYITQVYSPEWIPAAVLPGRAWFLGGDFHLGRNLAEFADQPEALDFLESRIRDATGGAPLILNLEGVLSEDPPPASQLHPMQIAMAAEPALELMRRWNVTAVVLANNHSLDLGAEGYATMTRLLAEAGIAAVGDRSWATFPDFDLFAASEIRNLPQPAIDLLRRGDLPESSPSGGDYRTRIAFFHWGREYREGPDERQLWLAAEARQRGFGLVAGCHSHLPSSRLHGDENGLVCWSLGNLLFDQIEPERGGLLLELRFFEQGTFAPRLVPLGNLNHEWRIRQSSTGK